MNKKRMKEILKEEPQWNECTINLLTRVIAIECITAEFEESGSIDNALNFCGLEEGSLQPVQMLEEAYETIVIPGMEQAIDDPKSGLSKVNKDSFVEAICHFFNMNLSMMCEQKVEALCHAAECERAFVEVCIAGHVCELENDIDDALYDMFDDSGDLGLDWEDEDEENCKLTPLDFHKRDDR